jgi:hypothetical protein
VAGTACSLHACSWERAFVYYLSDNYRFSLNIDGKDMFALAPSSVVLLEIFVVFRRILVVNAMDVYK